MFGVDSTELAVVAVLALIFIGPKDLPRVLRTLGYWVGRVRGMARHFTSGIESMVREVAAGGPDCISTFCTNLRAAPLVEALEREIGIPIYDTISVVVHRSLVLAGVDPARIVGWGRLFSES
jgi:Tat protein translocase TatB subunit